MTKLKPATFGDVYRVGSAIDSLRFARDQLKKAGASRAAEKVRTALKSAEGAERRVRRRHNHAKVPNH